MGQKWTAPGGWDIEAIVLDGKPQLRVKHRRALVAYVADLAALERLLERHDLQLGDLTEQPEG